MLRSNESHLEDGLLSPPSYRETVNPLHTLVNAENIPASTHLPANENYAQNQYRRHPCQAIIITAIIVGGVVLIVLILSFTFIFVRRNSFNPTTMTTTTTTTTKRPSKIDRIELIILSQIWFSIVCFDGDGLLVKDDGSRVKMRDLKVGDQIVVAYRTKTERIELRVSPVLAVDIFQKFNNNSSVDFLQIELESNEKIKSLHITPKHSLLVKKEKQLQVEYLFADQVQIGDYLYSTADDRRSTNVLKVARINKVKLFDAYAPLTFEGTLLVNDMIVSCYGTLEHSFVHLLMTPRRWLLYSAHQVLSLIQRVGRIEGYKDFFENILIGIDLFRLSIRHRVLDFIDLLK